MMLNAASNLPTPYVPAPMSSAEARVLTDQIKAAADQLWQLLLEAHDGKAWEALGYANFREYAKTEFGMGQSHAYRLLDQGRVIRALEAVAHSPVGEISERAARDIKPHLTLVTQEISDRIRQGESADVAVEAVISDTRKATYLGSRKRADRPNRWVETLVLDLRAIWLDHDPDEDFDVSVLDQTLTKEWAAELRKSARVIVKCAERLEGKR